MKNHLFVLLLPLGFLMTACLPSPDLPENFSPPAVSETADETADEPEAPKLIFHDSFQSNKNSWPTANTAQVLAEIRSGKYYFEHLRTSDSSWMVINRKRINERKDWSIETTIRFISGRGETTNFGLIFGYDFDLDAGYKFLISDNGQFEISMSNYGAYEVIQPPTESDALLQDGKMNALRVEQRDDLWYFFINDTEVFTLEPQTFYKQQVGYILYNNVAIEVDDLKIFN
jgi:hypothetical protein